MRKIITVNEMRACDLKTINSGISGKELMYRAALGIYNSCYWDGNIGIFCGSGNNAGDGYALATILKERNYHPEIILVSDKFSEDGLYYYNKCLTLNIPIHHFSLNLPKYDIYVDALLGTGFKGACKSSIKDCIDYLNSIKDKRLIAIDINSGLNGDNGMGESVVKSDLTISVGYLKPGLFLNKAKDVRKKVVNVDIGIECVDNPMRLLEKEDVKNFIKPRLNFSNKGTYGYVGILGGSLNYPGAVRLANLGQIALRSGCGVSKLIVPEDIYELIFNNVLETTVAKISSRNGKMTFSKEEIDSALKGLKVLGVGIGWSESDDYQLILKYILENYNIPVVIDADGLNTLAKMDLSILNNSKAKIILTPHLKEFSRLINVSVNDIINNLLDYAKEFVLKYNVTLLLKGPTTIVLDKNNVYFIADGNAGMATAGSGDVLTGIIVGMLGYHFEDITKTVAISAYLNAYAGDLAEKDFGQTSLLSSDTATYIGKALKELCD